ncbi:MAG TPA: PLP-dependent transferase [Planctomycetota bacterium]|nr:PLP-dependent transferase [Planctomycetota bacterium]
MDHVTRLLHSALDHGEGAPSSPPIDLSSVHVSAGPGDDAPYGYARLANPTWEALESALGALEGGACLAFASGQAATHAALMALCGDGRRLVLPGDGYYGTRKLCALLEGHGLRTLTVDLADRDAVARALGLGPSVLWVETPTNPFLRVFDIAHLVELARAAGAPVVVDNTTATAHLQRPLELGADLSVTSLTKASSGHSDVVLGALATADAELLTRLRAWRSAAGGIPGPFEAWVAHRGLLTLPLRIERQSDTALALARRLAEQPRVRAVHYPGLGDDRALVARQMSGRGGSLLSFELDGDAAAAERVVRAARLVRAATSFGGVESSWERRARWASETAPPSLIRMSVGLEPLGDLVADVERALEA